MESGTVECMHAVQANVCGGGRTCALQCSASILRRAPQCRICPSRENECIQWPSCSTWMKEGETTTRRELECSIRQGSGVPGVHSSSRESRTSSWVSSFTYQLYARAGIEALRFPSGRHRGWRPASTIIERGREGEMNGDKDGPGAGHEGRDDLRERGPCERTPHPSFSIVPRTSPPPSP